MEDNEEEYTDNVDWHNLLLKYMNDGDFSNSARVYKAVNANGFYQWLKVNFKPPVRKINSNPNQ